MYDLLVIGGGPSGSQVAGRLAGLGYRVVVVEQKASLEGPVCCTGIISQECATAFAIDDSVVFRRVNSARIFSPSGTEIHLLRPEPQASIVDRSALNVLLAHRAQSQGAEYRLGTEVSDIQVKDNGVKVALMGPEDRQVVEAKAIVVAAGFAPKLVEKLGLGGFKDFIMGAQAEVETSGVEEVEIYTGQKVAAGFFAWLVPTSPGRALAGLLSRRTPGSCLKKFLAFLRSQAKILSVDVALRHGGIPLKPLVRTYGDRMLVVGTAAGQVKPTTGGGIYYGLLCADMAAETLHLALRSGNLSIGNLIGYQRRWKRRLGQELITGYWARKFYQRLSDDQIDRIFNIVKSHHIDEALLADRTLSFDWHGSAVLRAVGYRSVSRVVAAMRIPVPGKSLRGL